MNKGEISFVQGALGKKILKFVFPLIIAYLIQQAYNSADLIIVGHYMGCLLYTSDAADDR